MLTDRKAILDKLRELVVSADPRLAQAAAAATEDTRLAQDLGMNSVSILYMAITVEDSFGIRFRDVGVSDFTALRDVIDHILRAQA